MRAVRPLDHGYIVETDDVAYQSAEVVIATGPVQTPRIPSIAKDLAAAVHQIRSGDYRRPDNIAEGPVLVVGGGNTGFQIAHELAATHEVHLAIGSRLAPLRQRLLGRDRPRRAHRLQHADPSSADSASRSAFRRRGYRIGRRGAVASLRLVR